MSDRDQSLWKRRVDHAEVERLCAALVRKVGREAAVTTHRLFKQLDKGNVINVGELEPRQLRKKVRHLCEAYTLSAVDMVAVPGAKPVVLSFRKPADCPLNLAHDLKQHLTAAVSRDAREEADIQGEADDKRAELRDVTDKEAAEHASRMDMIREALTAAQGAAVGEGTEAENKEGIEAENKEGKEPPKPAVAQGIMSLDEYRDLKDKSGGQVVAMQYTRDFDESDVPQKSLMELTREGVFGDTRGAADKFHRAIQKQDLWGKSSAAQRKRNLELNMRDTKRARLGEDADSEDEEPWNRFDRNKIFQPRQATEKEFDNLMNMAAEHKAGFTSGRIE